MLSQKISAKAAAKGSESAEARFDGICVAVVDDTKPNLILCKKLLELGGAVVETYNTGRAFLDACNEKKYDILLIDHMMPEMDGVEVLNVLKAGDGPNKDTPRLAFTANAMAGAEKEYMDYGFNGFISKPINRDEFASKILAALGR